MTEELSPAISFATALRDAGVRAQLHCEKKKFKQKLSYADKLSIPYAAFLGEDEIQQNKVTVKDLTTGQQQTVTAGEAVALVQAGLAARAGRLLRRHRAGGGLPRRQHLSRLCRCGRFGLVRRHCPDLL